MHLRVQSEAEISNLGDLDDVAAEKGGIWRLLDEKWRKGYQANAPRGLFTKSKLRTA